MGGVGVAGGWDVAEVVLEVEVVVRVADWGDVWGEGGGGDIEVGEVVELGKFSVRKLNQG